MKIKSKVLTTLAVTSAVVSLLTACGKPGEDKNPLKGYQAVNTAVEPHDNKIQDQFRPVNIYQIDVIEDLSFVQGQEKKVNLMVTLNMTNANQAKYVLRAQELPEGASLMKDNRTGFYTFKWRPASNTLNTLESAKIVPVKIHFVPIKENNPSYEFMRSQVGTRATEIRLTVLKDAAQPNLSETITYRPSQTVKANQSVSITVDVSAGGVRAADDIQVSVNRGPAKVARELVQMDGLIAVVENPTLVGSSSLTNSSAKATYQIKFETSRFVDAVMKQIEADSILKKRYKDGELNIAEASFNVQAKNLYNGSLSVERTVVVKVELPTPAVAPATATAKTGVAK